jgi:hypothetical protein
LVAQPANTIAKAACIRMALVTRVTGSQALPLNPCSNWQAAGPVSTNEPVTIFFHAGFTAARRIADERE